MFVITTAFLCTNNSLSFVYDRNLYKIQEINPNIGRWDSLVIVVIVSVLLVNNFAIYVAEFCEILVGGFINGRSAYEHTGFKQRIFQQCIFQV